MPTYVAIKTKESTKENPVWGRYDESGEFRQYLESPVPRVQTPGGSWTLEKIGTWVYGFEKDQDYDNFLAKWEQVEIEITIK